MQLLLNAINSEVITVIAKILHEANRHVCVTADDHSQPPWDKAPDWQKRSAIAGVRFALDNNFPSPEAMHESWLAQKSKDGWVYGEEKDAEAKTHPCMVPYEELDDHQQSKDWMFRTVMLSVLSIWSGAPHMGPQLPPVPYKAPDMVEPEPEAEPEEKPEDEDVVVLDDVDDNDGELTPQQKAARTRAANKAAKEDDDG